MYRVLIADDEIHVCQLVQYLVDWSGLNLELIGMAHSGVEAFEKIVECTPDIVISDIRMSGCSGVELLEKTRMLGLHCRFILISGYREFAFAQKAIRFGVTDYIVKPLKRAELIDAVQKAIDELNREGAAHEPKPGKAETVSGRERFAADLQSGVLPVSQAVMKCVQEVYGLDFSGVCTVFSWRFICHGDYSKETLRLLEGKVVAWLGEQGKEWFRTFAVLRVEGRLFLICAVDSDKKMLGYSLLRENCQAVISIFSAWEAALGVCQWNEEQPLDVPLKEAALAADDYIFDPGRGTYLWQHAARDITDFRRLVSYDDCEKLMSAMQVLDAAAVSKEIDGAFTSFAAQPKLSAQAVFGYAEWVISEMNHALSGFETGGDNAIGRYLDRVALMDRMYHSPSLGQIGLCLKEALTAQISLVKTTIRNAENRPVRMVKEIVGRRYMDQISLNEVAEEVGLNPIYLSMLFKKDTGTNFKDYLTAVRIETAKSLLRDGKTLSEIAEAVGYKDVRYFSKLFTRIVGVKPTQYKNLYN
ncbi:MAG: helix-turn-helix domain-containing protein [Eubacteriales bacterium]|nr:helix-turn-helix domain-containing protein [Eubacteriales bacterium]